MITLQEALFAHHKLILRFGGTPGVRDIGLLKSALARISATFDGVELYPEPIDKAAAILESIVVNHPFLDGNKRTGYVLARMVLQSGGKDMVAETAEKYAMVLAVSEGRWAFSEIRTWLNEHQADRN
ncbi:MAG: type II toxin-antitoxin system death-on-curing family toxin [Flavobacteriales bacterium]